MSILKAAIRVAATLTAGGIAAMALYAYTGQNAGALIGGVVLGSAMSAVLIRTPGHSPARPGEDWHVWDAELDGDLSDIERAMMRDGRVPTATDMRQALGDPVQVFHLNAEEWAAARQKALDELGCSWHELADMAERADFPSGEHCKVWGAMGGRTEYDRWASQAPVIPAQKKRVL